MLVGWTLPLWVWLEAGMPLAHLMGAELSRRGLSVPDVYSIDITLSHDFVFWIGTTDINTHQLPLSVDGLRLVLRMTYCLLEERFEQPYKRLVIMVGQNGLDYCVGDRGYRELPIQADIVGRK